MPTFTFTFIKPSTGRRNKGRRSAYDESALRAALAAEGIDEIDDLKAEPPEPATERQLDYIRDLGAHAPPGISMAEASDIITNATERREPAGQRERDLAAACRVAVTRFASKQAIYERIVDALYGRDDPSHLCRWYVFRVYRDLCDRSRYDVITLPTDTRLDAVVAVFAADAQAFASVRREAMTSKGWRWFGTYTAPDGVTYHGASRRTAAYAKAKALIEGSGLVRAQQFPPRAVSSPAPAAEGLDRDALGRLRQSWDDAGSGSWPRQAEPGLPWFRMALGLAALLALGLFLG